MASALAALDDHPRHVILFALAAGLLIGPLSPLTTILVAVATAVLVLIARAASSITPLASSSLPGASSSLPGASSSLPGAASSPLALAAAAAVLAGGIVADLRTAALERGPLPQMHGRSIEARAVLLEPVRERSRGPAVARARLVGGVAEGEVAVLRVQERVSPWPGVGEILAVAGEVAPLGRFDAYQRRRGATAAIDVSSLRPTGVRRGGVAGLVDAARRRAESGLARGLADGEAALLRGMVLGQTSG